MQGELLLKTSAIVSGFSSVLLLLASIKARLTDRLDFSTFVLCLDFR